MVTAATISNELRPVMDRFGGLLWECERIAALVASEDWASVLTAEGDVDDGSKDDGRTVLTYADLRRVLVVLQSLMKASLATLEDPTSKGTHDWRSVVYQAAVNPSLWANDAWWMDPDRVAPKPTVDKEKQDVTPPVGDVAVAVAVVP